MAIATDQVITQYLADASGHMRAVSQVVTSQKGMTKSVEETTAATQKSGNSATEFLSKWKIGAGSITSAISAMAGGFKELLTSQRLTAAAGSANIDALSKASAGLLERMDLLRLAAASQTGAFSLTQKQMEAAAGAIRALTRDGNDQAKVMDKVMEAITKGNGGGLDDFGILIDRTSSKLGDFNALMGALETQSNRVKGATRTQSEEIAGLGVSFEDSMSKIKISIGEIVVALQPLIEGVASLVSSAAGWVNNVTEFGGYVSAMWNSENSDDINKEGTALYKFFRKNETSYTVAAEMNQLNGRSKEQFMAELKANLDAMAAVKAAAKAESEQNEKLFRGTSFGDISLGGQFGAVGPMISFAAKPVKKSGGGSRVRTRGLLGRTGGAFASSQDGTISDGMDQKAYTDAAQLEADANAAQAATDAMNEQLESVASAMDEQMGLVSSSIEEARFLMSDAAESNNLSDLFGPIEDFDAYANAFTMLTGAVGSAMNAWIDGTGNAGQAVKHFIADSLKGAAIEMAVMSIKHAAYGFGALAFGNAPSATMHFKSAAMFGAGAIAAGVAANQLGTSAGDSGRASGGGQGAAPSTIGPVGQQGGPIIVYGDSFADDSPRMRQRKAEQLIETATGSGQWARSN